MIRKAVLGMALLMLSSSIVDYSAARTQKPVEPAKPPIVVVHGAWGGAWAFRHVESLLRDKGYSVHRPQLTGLGERAHLATPDINLSTNINDVVNMILFEDLHDVILVGHSYGGMVITGVADRVPERIRRLVYVDAFVPNDGESVMSLIGTRGDWLKPMIKGDYIVPPWVKPDQPPPKDVPQPLKTFTEPLVLKNKSARQIPATYILTVEKGHKPEDDDFAPQAQRGRRNVVGWYGNWRPTTTLNGPLRKRWWKCWIAPRGRIENINRRQS